jgi:hypothetical protein
MGWLSREEWGKMPLNICKAVIKSNGQPTTSSGVSCTNTLSYIFSYSLVHAKKKELIEVRMNETNNR